MGLGLGFGLGLGLGLGFGFGFGFGLTIGELLRAHVAESGALPAARCGLASAPIDKAEVEQRPVG